MASLFIPTYFSPIVQYAEIYKTDTVVLEVEDNYQKQTYRNRCYIYGANGKLSLNIPVKHPEQKTRLKTKDILVENDFPWQSKHFKSLQSAYRSSPFFEFLEDDLAVLFNKKYKYLLDINIDTYMFVYETLELDNNTEKTTFYQVNPKQKDYRNLALDKKGVRVKQKKYVQVFDDKYGFIPNLSILDLLFMEGSNAVSYLEKAEHI